jgi:hypothetical protein
LEDSGKQAKDLVRQEARARREDVTSTMPMLMRAIETRWLHEMQVLPGARHRHVEEPGVGERRNRTFTPRLERGRASNFAGDFGYGGEISRGARTLQRAFRRVNRCVSAQS